MRIARYIKDGVVSFGIVEGDGDLTVTVLRGEPFERCERDGEPVPLSDVELLAPTVPTKIVGFGRNYAPAVRKESEEPSFFLKPPSSIIPTGGVIRLPRAARGGALFEVELAVVIGRTCRDVRAEDIDEVVFGYSIVNDVSGVDLERVPAGNYPVKAKGYDTFCPFGPWVETELDPSHLEITCQVNGEIRQQANTSQMMTSVPDLVAIASGVMTLLPGDIILTGTPPGLSPLKDGDWVEGRIQGIGQISNPVVGPR
jgi:2-keto-4-pentenoate hydratase/2-oxohepta-3-ene-1,7-dioic acid hydratase in catechol pathway